MRFRSIGIDTCESELLIAVLSDDLGEVLAIWARTSDVQYNLFLTYETSPYR